MMDEFDIQSSPEKGTRVVVVKWHNQPEEGGREW